ncbi:hypothetical protein [Streptosporangium carneum]|uniref:Uncharacterized protein n=1 Tax=Streptosporangium carneum TaxID=47481 RepID=A0A9W6I6Y3_9ACTN|nr:hypothetical protein [Streptosporangium carneum]GLK12374.1 hypothetical protein GCM10017600_57840 [Streptosporangium carneum]
MPAGEAEVTEEQRAELAQVREARLEALETLDKHPFWAEQQDRHEAWMALRTAVKA